MLRTEWSYLKILVKMGPVSPAIASSNFDYSLKWCQFESRSNNNRHTVSTWDMWLGKTEGLYTVCDTCYQWYHTHCQSMKSSLYLEHVDSTAVAWDCIVCNAPNYSTFCLSMVFIAPPTSTVSCQKHQSPAQCQQISWNQSTHQHQVKTTER